MSKHWNPRIAQSGRRWHPRRRIYRATNWSLSWGEVRLTLLGGLFLGLAYALIPAPDAAAPDWNIEAPDPWAESHKSRAILEAQEGTPPSAIEGIGGDRVTVGRGDAVDVIDGDTFDFGGQRIRIADIDTPEVNGRCDYETRLAAQATRRMAQLLSAGAFELQPIDRDTDKYGRKLRIVTRNGRSIGDQMVAEGLARSWTGRRRPWC